MSGQAPAEGAGAQIGPDSENYAGDEAPLPADVPYPPSLDNVTIYSPYGPMSMDPTDGQPVQAYWDLAGLRDYGARCIAWAASQAQPKRTQEPVAWQAKSKLNGTWGPPVTREKMAESLRADGYEVRALYAAPVQSPAPGALTDDQIVAAWDAWPHTAITSRRRAVAFVRSLPVIAPAVGAQPQEVQDAAWRKWADAGTVGSLIAFLGTLDQAAPIVTAYHVTMGSGERRCKTHSLTISRERVDHATSTIRSADTSLPYTHVLWAHSPERALPPVEDMLVLAVECGVIQMSKVMDADLQDALTAFAKRLISNVPVQGSES
jgi:hypothetical protein